MSSATGATGCLTQLFQHQTRHRGQVQAMRGATEAAPPQQAEHFSVGEARLPAAEFAELGWTESGIWGEAGGERR